MGDVRNDLGIVKKALVGDDLCHGLVKTVGEIKAQVTSLITDKQNNKESQKEKRETSLKWKLAAVGLTFTLFGILLQELLSHI